MYRALLKTAWRLARQNPILWPFAFFVGFLGTAGEVGIIIASPSLGADPALQPFFNAALNAFVESGVFGPSLTGAIAAAYQSQPLRVLGVLLMITLGITVVLAVVWLIIVCQAALLFLAQGLVVGQQRTVRQAWSVGLRQWPGVLALNLIASVLFGMIFVVLRALSVSALPWVVFLCIFTALIIFLLIAAFVIKYSLFEVVLQNKSLLTALRSALQTWRRYWLETLEISIILFVIYSVVMISFGVLGTMSYRLLGPLVLLAPAANIVYLGVQMLIFVIAQIIMGAFHWLVWVIVFASLTSQEKPLLASWLRRVSYQRSHQR